MIRTTLSVCALFAALLLASRWVVLSNAAVPTKTHRGPSAATKPAKQKPAPPKPTLSASQPESHPSAAKTSIKLPTVAGAPFKMPDGCVEIQLGDAHRIVGANTDGRERVAPAEYLQGPIPTPHDYVLRPVDFEEEPADETDDVFGVLPRVRVSRSNDSSRVLISDVLGEVETEEETELELEPAPFRGEGKPLAEDDADEMELELDGEATLDAEMADEDGDATLDAEIGGSDTDEIITDSEFLKDEASSPEEDAAIEEDATTDTAEFGPVAPKKEIELTPELIALREKLRDCLAHYYYRPENVATRSPWGAMHYMLAYGVDSQLIAGNRKVNAVGWLCYNGVCNGQNLFWAEDGKLHARIGVGVQGHAGQYLAMLAQSKVPADFPIKTVGHDFTIADLIQHEKDTCKPNTELTFKLIALMHYCKSDEQWISDEGQEWNIPRLIKEELRQPIIGAACGGTHRLMGFSYAIRKRQQRNEEFSGQWLRAKKFIDDYHEYTFRLQNPDGSFSTEWFAGRGDFGAAGRRLETTGHTTEWLAYSLSEEQLIEPRMVKSVAYLTDLLYEGRNSKWNIGPLGHGLHALAIYDERVFGGKPGQRQEQLASHEKALAAKRRPQEPRRR